MKRYLSCAVLCLALCSCAVFPADRYATTVDNLSALRSINSVVNVEPFTAPAYLANSSKISCTDGVGMSTADEQPFPEYIYQAFVDELKNAGSYSKGAPITLYGNLDLVRFTLRTGKWDLGLTIKSSNGKSISATESYPRVISFYQRTHCDIDAHFFMPAVQDLLGKIIQSPEFRELLRS